MRRRDVVAAVVAAATLQPLAGRAEDRPRRLAMLMASREAEPEHQAGVAALRRRLQELGWREGDNLRIDIRWGGGQPEVLRRGAAEIVALAPDVIVANGTPTVMQLKPLTRAVPIVCAPVTAPVDFGFVASLARPGGNITGFTYIEPQLLGKWLSLLKQAAPALTRAGVLYNPRINPWYAGLLRDSAAAPQATALEIVGAPVETADALVTAVEQLGRTPGTGLIIGPEAFVIGHLREVLGSAAARRMPGISVYRQFVAEGGLMTYGPDLPDIFRQGAEYVDRILRGADPAVLPVQEPTKFDFAINQKAASALGLTLSPTLLAGADEVVE